MHTYAIKTAFATILCLTGGGKINIYALVMHNYESKIGPKTPVGIVGARGYSGLELARLLLQHPQAHLKSCFATDASFQLSDYLPEAAAGKVRTDEMSELLSKSGNLNTVFLATPAEVSLELAPKLIRAGVNVIDLSGAFRLEENSYNEWYSFTHNDPALLAQAEYGLVPWAGPARLSDGARLIANPGCYATSVLMGILPLLKSTVIYADTLVIDAKSGTTGAGRKASENLLFSEVEGECLPYKVGKHQHFPEICRFAQKFSNATINPHFSTSLINVRRGIISGIYARLANGKTSVDVAKAFQSAYENYPLVSFSALDPKTSGSALSLKKVVGSARTHIRYHVDGDKLYVYSLIDNLMKGAASQAIENFNRLLDLPVSTALTQQEGTL